MNRKTLDMSMGRFDCRPVIIKAADCQNSTSQPLRRKDTDLEMASRECEPRHAIFSQSGDEDITGTL